MFGGKQELAVMMAQIEKRIDPGIKIGGASQAVTGAAIGREILARMVDYANRGAGLALEQAEITEQGGDLARRVFIDGMKPDQGIEKEKDRTMELERGLEALLISEAVQAESISADHPDIQRGQIEAVVPGQRFEAQAQVGCRIFRRI